MVDRLVALGHAYSDIAGYTIPQAMAFDEIGERRKGSDLRTVASLMRSAYHAEPEQFTKSMKTLTED